MSRCLVYMAAAVFAASIPAQATPVDPHPAITTSAGPNNTCIMTWPGQTDYTYFIQITLDPVNGPWEFAPFIEYGTGADISWGFCSTEPVFLCVCSIPTCR